MKKSQNWRSRTTRCDSFSMALRATSSDLTLSNLLTN
ncbi:hypothetical protein Gotur_016655, partial [Gossypium turneri]